MYIILEKNTLKKYDLQEIYNYFKIKFKISFVNWAPVLQIDYLSNVGIKKKN